MMANAIIQLIALKCDAPHPAQDNQYKILAVKPRMRLL